MFSLQFDNARFFPGSSLCEPGGKPSADRAARTQNTRPQRSRCFRRVRLPVIGTCDLQDYRVAAPLKYALLNVQRYSSPHGPPILFYSFTRRCFPEEYPILFLEYFVCRQMHARFFFVNTNRTSNRTVPFVSGPSRPLSDVQKQFDRVLFSGDPTNSDGRPETVSRSITRLTRTLETPRRLSRIFPVTSQRSRAYADRVHRRALPPLLTCNKNGKTDNYEYVVRQIASVLTANVRNDECGR